MRLLFLLTATVLSLTILCAQSFPVDIARWKNNAKGAYNIIHDDYGDAGVDGIQFYADSMNANRGLKMTFGAITSTCEWRSVNWKGTNRNMYFIAKEMVEQRGHEIINHSHTHSCAVNNSNCGGVGTNHGWSTMTPHRMDIEITQSTNSIRDNTGYTPKYYIYPYDQFSTISNNFLKTSGYIGSRTGSYDAAEVFNFAPDADGFFRNAFVVDVQNQSGVTKAVRLNHWVDFAINNQTWVNRELHNVGNNGWGHVTVDEYRNHLNYLKQKVDANDIWVGTISEVLTYQIQKLNYTPSSTYDATNKRITVNWNNPSFNVANYLSNLQFKSPITLNVNVSAVPTSYRVFQNGIELTDVKRVGNVVSVNVYPHLGSVVLSEENCATLCVVQHPNNATVNAGLERLVIRGRFNASSSINYQWFKDDVLLNGETRDSIVITNVQASNAGSYVLRATSGSNTLNSNPAILTVNFSTPFGGTRGVIPGRIEAEHFDEGPQGLAFNESTTQNQGDATSFRNGPVDIEVSQDVGGGYNVGYITNGEWLTYSVNVQSTGTYDFAFRVASNVSTAKSISLYVDDVLVISNVAVGNTSGWQNWQTVNVLNVPLTAGERTFRIQFNGGDFNFNYFSTTLQPLSLFRPKPLNSLDGEQVMVYPNPIKDILTVDNLSNKYMTVDLIDASGNLVESKFVAESEKVIFNTNYLKSGIYLVLFKSNDHIFQKVLVKE
ncbi:MAG: carbohydrate-binding protein [Cytophagales bacterium]